MKGDMWTEILFLSEVEVRPHKLLFNCSAHSLNHFRLQNFKNEIN